MASQARNGENEAPMQRKVPSSWNSKPGQLSPDVQDPVGLCAGPVQRLFTVENRVCDFNLKLLNMNKFCDQVQWAALIDEFFEPGSHLGISITLENGINRFQINRTLIPRFFMTYFDCIVEPQFILNQIKVVSINNHTQSVIIDCPNGYLMTMHPLGNPDANPSMNVHGREVNQDFASIVRMECRFHIEFGTHSQRFRNFSFSVRNHQELIPRHMMREFGPNGFRPNLTRSGLPNHVISFLRMCNTVGPMQGLIIRQKQTNSSPKESLRAAVIERFQQITNVSQRPPNGRPSPPVTESAPAAELASQSGFQRPVPKQRRRRKQADNTSGAPPKRGNRRANQQPPAYETSHETNSATAQRNVQMRFDGKRPMEVEDPNGGMMLVGSPVIMGKGIKMEEERLIRKMENTPLYSSDGSATAFSPQDCSPTTNY